jgi:hypothetical protein
MAGKLDFSFIYPTTLRSNETVLDITLGKFRHFSQFMSGQITKTHIVQAHEEGRPELISFNEYGTTELWWIILQVNGINSAMDVTPGQNLSIPSVVQVESYFQLIANMEKGQSSAIRQ